MSADLPPHTPRHSANGAHILVRATDPAASDASSLIQEASDEQNQRYGRDGGASADSLTTEGVIFAVASIDGQAAGCGGVLPYADGIGEVTRMYVTPAARRRGVASAVLAWLEDAAADRYDWLRLETGTLQPESIALYEARGFERIDCWGPSADNPLSLCYEKHLTAE